ncbi:hypothetical protein D1007_22436 [Hordeum vulgare]|nr:hypothetical protein D1007_22436 [Hordeum vulgare]
MATEQYAKGSSDALATEVVDIEEETSKKHTTPHEEVEQSTNAEKSSNTKNNAIDGLWESMKVLPGFSLDYLAHYYAYLVDNPRVAMAFKVLEEEKKVWVSSYFDNQDNNNGLYYELYAVDLCM